MKTEQAKCDAFNRRVRPNDPVLYWPGVRNESTQPKQGITNSTACVVSGTAGVFVRPGGFMALSHVEPLSPLLPWF